MITAANWSVFSWVNGALRLRWTIPAPSQSTLVELRSWLSPPPPTAMATVDTSPEDRPLLHEYDRQPPARGKHRRKRIANPLPWRQFSLVLFIKACDALVAEAGAPYVNELVAGLDITGGDERKVGYYIGLLGMLGSISGALTVFYWNRLSDRIGRKPVLLMAMAGSITSTLLFGLSRTFSRLVASRLLGGLLSATIGVVRTAIGELTDSSNRANGFAIGAVMWAAGGSVGSLMGGSLAKPGDRFPDVFSGAFWKQYPYFLPCLAVSSTVSLAFFITLFFFKETLPARKPELLLESNSSILSPRDDPLPLKELLKHRPVLIALANFCAIVFISLCQLSFFPVFLATPISIGGLGLDSKHIGYVLAFYRAFTAFVLLTCFSPLSRYLGERRIFIFSTASFLIIWTSLPLINFYARHFGVSTGIWASLIVFALPATSMDVAHAAFFVLLTATAPNRRTLGAVNGLAQTAAVAASVVAPMFVNSMFSFSVEHDLLGGYAMYVVLFVMSSCAVWFALKLPDNMKPAWEDGDEDED